MAYNNRRPSAAQPQQSVSLHVAVGGVVAGLLAAWFYLPGFAVVWIGLAFAAFGHPAPMLTGKADDAKKGSAAADAGERQQQRIHAGWVKMRSALFGAKFAPGKPVRLAFVWAVLAAIIGWLLPVATISMQAINAVCAALSVSAVSVGFRYRHHVGDESPGARISHLASIVNSGKASDAATRLILKVAAAVSAVVAIAVAVFVPSPATLPTSRPRIAIGPWKLEEGVRTWDHIPVLTGLLVGALLFWSVWSYMAVRIGMLDWHALIGRRREYDGIWRGLKTEPSRLLTIETVGPVTVETFDAPAGLGSAGVFGLATKLSSSMPSTVRLAVLDTPALQGDVPVPGTIDPRRWQLVQWPLDAPSNICDPAIDQATAELLFRCGTTWSWVAVGFARTPLTRLTRVSVEGQPSLWAFEIAFPGGPNLTSMVVEASKLGGAVGGGCWIDPMTNMALVGAHPSTTEILEESPIELPADVDSLERWVFDTVETQEWHQRWTDVLKMGEQKPYLQPAVSGQHTFKSLSGTGTIQVRSFKPPQGVDPIAYFGAEPRLSTALDSAPFVAVTGYPDGTTGGRHPGAFSVAWTNDIPPAGPEALAASDPAGDRMLLAGWIGSAFDAVKLRRCEVATRGIQCLTDPTSRKHLWKVPIRLHGGVTVQDVRLKEAGLRSALGVAYLRLLGTPDDPDSLTLVAGGDHRTTMRLGKRSSELDLWRWDWDSWFATAGVTAHGGERPQLLSAPETVDADKGLRKFVFEFPPGMDFSLVKIGSEKIRTAGGWGFLQTIQEPTEPTRFSLLVGDRFPLDSMLPFNFERQAQLVAEHPGWLPFGDGVLTAAAWDITQDSALLVVGRPGSGKSVTVQALVYGACAARYVVVVSDPLKAGADYKFAAPFYAAFIDTEDVGEGILATAALMRRVLAAVAERKRLNSRHGVGKIGELPDGVRPEPMIVFLDEFFSMVAPVTVPPKSDDPRAARERAQVIELNSAKAEIVALTGRAVREARSAGVHIVVVAQRPESKVMSGELKANLSARLMVGQASVTDRQVALTNPAEAPAVPPGSPKGRSVFESSISATQLVQTWYGAQPVLQAQLEGMLQPLTDDERLETLPMVADDFDADEISADWGDDDVSGWHPVADVAWVSEVIEGELDIEDWGLTLDDLAGPAAPTVVLDGFHGVLAPEVFDAADLPDTWSDWTEIADGTWVSPAMLEALAAAGVHADCAETAAAVAGFVVLPIFNGDGLSVTLRAADPEVGLTRLEIEEAL